MTDESLTIASDPTLEDADALVVASAENLIEAIRIYTLLKLTQPEIKERVSRLGFEVSLRTIQNRVKDLRKAGQLPAVGEAPSTQRRHRQQERSNRKNCGMSTQPTSTPTTTNDLPHHPASTPQQQCVQADGWSDATVVTAEVVTMPDGERDFQRAQELFAELFTLSKRNFKDGWTELQWNTLGGECRTLAECCDARGKRQRSRPQRQVFSHAAN